jgi:hypothetical protein
MTARSRIEDRDAESGFAFALRARRSLVVRIGHLTSRTDYRFG